MIQRLFIFIIIFCIAKTTFSQSNNEGEKELRIDSTSAFIFNASDTIIAESDKIDSLQNIRENIENVIENRVDGGEEFLEAEVIPELIYDTVQNRLNKIPTSIPLHFNEKIFSFINYFTIRNREYIKKVMEKEKLYFPIFEKYLAEYGLPDELKYLSIVESGLRTDALSRAGAGGLWQFIRETGRLYNLKQTSLIDERMDPYKATQAACLYLKDLYGIFGDWELALSAYNSGPGNVYKAIRRSNNKRSFWEIYKRLPRETRSYVPQFIAIIYTMKYHEEHNLYSESNNYMMRHDTLLIHKEYAHLDVIANMIGICYDDLIILNPELYRGVTPYAPYPLRIPEDKKEVFTNQKNTIIDSAHNVGKKHLKNLEKLAELGGTYGRELVKYKIRYGDNLGSIAARYNVRVSDIRRWNKLSSNFIRKGQTLKIWVLPRYFPSKPFKKMDTIHKQKPPLTKSIHKEEKQQNENVPGVYHTVKAGDSLWKISQQYKNSSIQAIKKINKLRSSRLQVGQKLLIYPQ